MKLREIYRKAREAVTGRVEVDKVELECERVMYQEALSKAEDQERRIGALIEQVRMVEKERDGTREETYRNVAAGIRGMEHEKRQLESRIRGENYLIIAGSDISAPALILKIRREAEETLDWCADEGEESYPVAVRSLQRIKKWIEMWAREQGINFSLPRRNPAPAEKETDFSASVEMSTREGGEDG